MGKKPYRISIKNSLPYLKCVSRLSCVVHGPFYGRFMGFYGKPLCREKTVYIPIKLPYIGPWTTQERRNTHFK